MKSNWLYDQSALWTVVVLIGAMMLASELAYRMGRRWHSDTQDAGRDVFVAIKVSLLGLLALLLAFTFSMAVERYNERQRLVLDEANLLHSLLLRSSLLPEPPRSQFQQYLREFVGARLEFFNARRNLVAVEKAIDRTESLHRQMWMLIAELARRDPTMNGVDPLVKPLTDIWSIHRQRVHAFENRVPDPVILLLFGGAIVCLAAVGFADGIANHRGTVGKILLAVLLAGTIFVVLDLDRPRRGIFEISQEPMLHLKEVIERDAGTGP